MRRKSVCVLGAVVLAGTAAAAVPFARSASEQAGGTQDGKSGESGAGSRSEGTVPPIAKVADDLYIIQGQSGKTAMLVAANGVVLVDPVTPENGQTLFDVVKSVTDKPVTHVIITHAHVYNTHTDIISTHLAGGVTGGQIPATVGIVMHEKGAAAMRHAGGWLPNRTYKKSLTVLKGRDAIDLYHFGPAHTDGDTFVVFRRQRVMYAGDVFATKGLPFIDVANGGSGILYPDTLAQAARGIKGVDSVIAGRIKGPSVVQTWQDFLDFGESTDVSSAMPPRP